MLLLNNTIVSVEALRWLVTDCRQRWGSQHAVMCVSFAAIAAAVACPFCSSSTVKLEVDT